MAELPSGTVTLLFTDLERSTELVKRLREGYGQVLAKHRALLRAAFSEHGGTEVDTQGDSFFVVFASAPDAVAAAVAVQRAVADYAWPGDAPVSVRIGLHTGEPDVAEHGYAGLAVHRAARICTIAHGGQVLLSRSTAGIVDDEEIPGVALRDLGEHRLKDIDRPERIFQLVIEGVPSDFSAPRTMDEQIPLAGTVTVVAIEGRRMMRLSRELPPDIFGALLEEYQRLVQGVLKDMGGRQVEAVADSASAVFSAAKQAAFAAAAAQRAMAGHEWPEGLRLAIGVGLHSGVSGIGWVGVAGLRSAELCDAAEGGQTLLTPVTAGLLEEENLGDLYVRELGEVPLRRSKGTIRAYELVVPAADL